MRAKCAEKTSVGLGATLHPPWVVISGVMGSRCYKWYQSNPVVVTDSVFSASSGEKILKLRRNEDVAFLNGSECECVIPRVEL